MIRDRTTEVASTFFPAGCDPGDAAPWNLLRFAIQSDPDMNTGVV